MTTSIHDHHVVALNVDVAARTIRLRTAYPEPTGPNFTDVVFEGVEGYTLRGDALGTILFDIERVEAISLYREYAVEMQRTYADSGGHGPWVRSESAAEAFLAGGEIQGHRVSSSIGLDGAIWARGLSISGG
jgi:hypothetical protein